MDESTKEKIGWGLMLIGIFWFIGNTIGMFGTSWLLLLLYGNVPSGLGVLSGPFVWSILPGFVIWYKYRKPSK